MAHGSLTNGRVKAERLEHPPASMTRAAQIISSLLLTLAAAQRRIARLETLDRQKAVELDRLGWPGRRLT